LDQQPIPLISPSASDETVGGPNFFRIVPPDSSQASLAVKFALNNNRWPPPKNVAIITTYGNSSTSNYPGSLASSFKQELDNKPVKTGLYSYIFNDPQTVKSALTEALAAKPDLIFFSGYGPDLKTLLEEQSNNSDPKLKTIPIIVGDSASAMSDYNNMSDCSHVNCRHLPSGLGHTYFTSFASEETNPNADFFKTFRQMFFNPTQVNNVEEPAILEYDALGALLCGYQYQQNSRDYITLSQALRMMGTYQGVSGQITFDSSSSGNPKNKTVVLEHVVGNQLQILDRCGSYQIEDQTPPC